MKLPRALRQLPPSPIGDAPADQLVRIEGFVEVDGEPLTAPISGRACVYYFAEVNNTSITVPIREVRALSVRVRDASGAVVVDLGSARVAGGAKLGLRRTLGLLFGTRAPPEVMQLMRRHRKSGYGYVSDQGIESARERIVAVGDRVVCAGRVRRDVTDGAAGADDPYRGTATRLVLQPAADQPVLVAVVEK